jgi:hypothetical protein
MTLHTPYIPYKNVLLSQLFFVDSRPNCGNILPILKLPSFVLNDEDAQDIAFG